MFHVVIFFSAITVPAGINGTSQCDTYRCDITYKDGTKTNGTTEAYCNNGTGNNHTTTVLENPSLKFQTLCGLILKCHLDNGVFLK